MFRNPYTTMWLKLALYNVTIVPAAIYGAAAWNYKPQQLLLLDLTQAKILKLIMQPRTTQRFTLLEAIRIAERHNWHHLHPIGYYLGATQIKFRTLLSPPLLVH